MLIANILYPDNRKLFVSRKKLEKVEKVARFFFLSLSL